MSYDCLDEVRPVITYSEFPESAVRDEPDDSDDDTRIVDHGTPGKIGYYDAAEDIDLPETPPDDKPPVLKEGEEPPDRSHLKRKADIDYGYPKKEFRQGALRKNVDEKGEEEDEEDNDGSNRRKAEKTTETQKEGVRQRRS